MNKRKNTQLYDFIIIGSGFGGSTSALRLSEKGYSVAVLEKGREFKDEDFPKTNWNIKRFLWAPLIGCFGFQRISWFKEVLILSGAGVGGGSLVYANTLMNPPDKFFENPVWSKFKNWKEVLTPFYKKAEFMLGATENPWTHRGDELLAEVARDMGKSDTVENVKVGVYFGDVNKEKDPYFNGHGPKRLGCTACAGCMVGCRYNAKNTLVKNYLFFARKFGAKVYPKTYVDKVEKINDEYHIHTYKTGSWFKRIKVTYRSKGVVFSGGVLGTMDLLLKQKHSYKSLPLLSETLGEGVRTNSEMLVGVTSKNTKLNEGVAISSIMNPDVDTHVEIVKYSNGSDFMKVLTFPFVELVRFRFIKSIFKVLSNPFKYIKLYFFTNWAANSIIFLVMQNIDSSMKLELKKWPFNRLSFNNKGQGKVPFYIPGGVEILKRYTEKVKGIAQSASPEVLLNKPATAHILGGAVMGESRETGVVNDRFEVFGYPNMYILDGSIVPCNIGVNPSLTITSLTEYAMSLIPEKSEGHQQYLDDLLKT